MARINIEERWWTDIRRKKLIKLVGSEVAADGAALMMWRLAQDFWKIDGGRVPLDIWEHFEFGSACVDAGLAVVDERSVYVRGSSSCLDWTREQREIAVAAGKKSAEVRRAKTGTAQPSSTISRTDAERTPNDLRTEINVDRTESNVAELSVSGSGSGSESGSEELLRKGVEPSSRHEPNGFEETGQESKRSPRKSRNSRDKTEAGESAAPIIARWYELWREQYHDRAPLLGPDHSKLKRLATDLGSDQALRLVEGYFRMRDRWISERRHDVQTLVSNLSKVQAFVAVAPPGGANVAPTPVIPAAIRQMAEERDRAEAERKRRRAEILAIADAEISRQAAIAEAT